MLKLDFFGNFGFHTFSTDNFEKFRGIFHREIQVKSSLNHKFRSVFSIFKICLIVPSIADSTNFVGPIYI